MTENRTLTIVLDEGKTETGIWCSDCNLPSGWITPVLELSESGVGCIGTMSHCEDCEQPLPRKREDASDV